MVVRHTMADKLEIFCPCCKAMLVVDTASGQVLMHKEKSIKGTSLESMLANLEAQKSEAAKRLEKEMESQKDRSRLLDAKFKEALERAKQKDP